MYLVGSNKKESKFRVLKIDRTEPKDLVIYDDRVEYSQNEIKNLLAMIESGNRGKSNMGGLTRTVSAYGIVGFVKFLTGYYIILIKKRRMVASIGPHTIYKIEDTCMLYIPNDTIKGTHPDESRYEKMFQNVDLSSNFYFSYSYDLTHSLQYNMQHIPCAHQKPDNDTDLSFVDHSQFHNGDTVCALKNAPCRKFVWNNFLLETYEDSVHTDWLVYITHGFIGQSSISVFGKPLYLTLIARRSNQFAGTRFLKRGANCQGSVANDIETEQIVNDASVTVLKYGRVTSYIQQRGSVPLFWSQDVSTIVPKPPITLDKMNPYGSMSARHFSESLSRYGAPIIVLNLVKTRENRRHESLLSVNLKDQCVYLNQFLPADYNIRHIGFDMARVNKQKNSNVLLRLEQIAKDCLKETGLFVYSRKPVHPEFWNDARLASIKGVKTKNGSRQTGIVRTNCVDCLDRTNTAQFSVGKCVLAYQLYILGVISKPGLQFETDCVRMLEDLYEDHGDTLALQYGGSHLVHRVNTYKKIAPWTSHSRDIMHTLSRYYSNAFSDAEKQQAINLFLGIFRPSQSNTNLWELSTDYYLHNSDAAGAGPVKRRSYTQWYDKDILKHLPLSHEEETKDRCKQLCNVMVSRFDDCVNTFEQYHLPYELTVMEDKYSYNLTNSTRDFMPKAATDFSPFCLRVRAAHLHVEKESESPVQSTQDTPNMVTTASDTSSESDTSSVTGQSELVDTSSDSEDDCEFRAPKSQLRSLPSSKDVYNFEVIRPSRVSELIYKRYAEIDHLARADIDEVDRYMINHLELAPISVFKLDSIYGVELPSLSRHTKDIYAAAVQFSKSTVWRTHEQDTKIYRKYVAYKYI